MSRSKKLKRPSVKKKADPKKGKGKPPWEKHKKKEKGPARAITLTAVATFCSPFISVGVFYGNQLMNHYALTAMKWAVNESMQMSLQLAKGGL